ncbi:Crp/Fnr family transcriptional regulator [Desulforamulus aeronauticus]|nr:Crp/Fnr family transcriptional regulator [Desulforamulus aeronauticus]
MTEKEALLSTSPWVKAHFLQSEHLNADDIALINRLGDKKHYPKGSVIIDIGSRGDYMYFVLKGTVRISLLSADGVEKPVSYVTQGCFLGEESFFHGQPTIYNALAVEAVEALSLDRKYLKEIISRPGLAHILLNSVSFKSRVLAHQIEDLAFRSTIEKVSRILYCILAETPEGKEKHHTIHISQQELAALAGAHRVSITNAISQLKKDEVIKTAKDGSIVVIDWDKLKEKGFGI